MSCSNAKRKMSHLKLYKRFPQSKIIFTSFCSFKRQYLQIVGSEYNASPRKIISEMNTIKIYNLLGVSSLQYTLIYRPCSPLHVLPLSCGIIIIIAIEVYGIQDERTSRMMANQGL